MKVSRADRALETQKWLHSEGLKLLTPLTEFKNVNTTIDVQCVCGEAFKARVSNLRKMEVKRCRQCILTAKLQEKLDRVRSNLYDRGFAVERLTLKGEGVTIDKYKVTCTCRCSCNELFTFDYRAGLVSGKCSACLRTDRLQKARDDYKAYLRGLNRDSEDVWCIPLNNSDKTVFIDKADFNRVVDGNVWVDDGSGYAIRRVSGSNTTEKMHRIITDAPEGTHVDHINRKPWDNRRCNLRVVNTQQNSFNKTKYSTNKTGYKGVSVHAVDKYTAQITYSGKKVHLGVFTNKEEAALAYNEAAVKYFGEHAVLNKLGELK